MADEPKQKCDLVMKGGTTSGTLYPKAVQEIMKKYRLVNIGGTSAGAIAAAAAAAAEKGREYGSRQKLEEMATELPTRLLSFFQPRKESRFLFEIGLVWLRNNQSLPRFVYQLIKLWAWQYIKSFSLLAILVFFSGLAIGTAWRYNTPLYLWLSLIHI